LRYQKAIACLLATVSLSLSSCGGGSGGGTVATVPTPPAPPAATNSSITNLQANQNFAVDSASVSTAIDLTAKTITNAATAPSSLQVSYDASTKSYSVTGTGRSQTFQPSDIQTGTSVGETRYVKTGTTGNDYLTLVTTPYSGITSNQYVGLGYWQRNVTSAGVQNTSFDSFVYGLDTAAAMVPRTGNAGYVTDNFGFVTIPGKAPLAFTGAGTFNIDLALGTFLTKANVYEYELTSARAQSGGGLQLLAAGQLGSNNAFSGNMTYSDTYATVSGTIAGRFFGPSAQELGASFSANNAAGAAVTGSLTGQSSSSVPAANVSITNYVADQLFYTSQAMLSIGKSASGTAAINYRTLIGQVTRQKDGGIVFVPGESDYQNVSFAAGDQVADSRPNFVTYSKTELALTYAGFGSWTGGAASGYGPFDGHVYFAYGIVTPTGLLSHKTGTATYSGVAYGIAAARDGSVSNVTGSSQFGVDFSAQKFNGSLRLAASQAAGVASRDLGSWTFADHIASGQLITTNLTAPAGSTGAIGTIAPQFYGPDGQEIGATFSLQTGADNAPDTLSVVGATVAKRH
jgi:hypothetical protein